MEAPTSRFRTWAVAGAGLLLLAAYWLWIKPPGNGLGYSGDMCSDIVRQMMARHLGAGEGIRFSSDLVMAPDGTSVPFMSWSIERDWLGAYAWLWNPSFPYLWVYLGVSWLLTYVFVAWVIRKLGLSRSGAWIAALVTVLVHVPRHYKIWHHFEHLTQHWVYGAFFLDALIWHRFTRERRFSRALELWRAFVQLGAFCSTGYFWGITVFEWLTVRACLAGAFAWRRRRGEVTRLEGDAVSMALPGALCLVLLAIEVPWFAALARELRGNEKYLSVNSWFANPLFLWRPLWLDYLPGLPQRIFSHFNRPETVVSIGCFLSVPAVIAIHRARRRAGGQGLIHLLPFLLFFLFGILYISDAFPWPVQMLLPFMSFFRVASRWGLFFPQLAMILILLSWPDTRGWFKSFPRRHRAWAAVFALSFVGEASLLLDPINALPKIPPAVEQVLRGVKEQPGDTVLDLPFCVAGGNGVCTQEQCPQYPGSIAGQCFRQWHGKKTYGLYQPRMYPSQCEIYERAPFQSWFSAWRENRCFSPGEWTEFCGYLDRQTSLSAVFLYPGIWGAAGRKSCRAQFDQHLGAALGSGEFMTEPTRGALGKDPAAIVWYAPRCRR